MLDSHKQKHCSSLSDDWAVARLARFRRPLHSWGRASLLFQAGRGTTRHAPSIADGGELGSGMAGRAAASAASGGTCSGGAGRHVCMVTDMLLLQSRTFKRLLSSIQQQQQQPRQGLQPHSAQCTASNKSAWPSLPPSPARRGHPAGAAAQPAAPP